MNPAKPIILSILFFLLIWFIWSFNLKPLQINKEINWADYYVRTEQCQKALEKMEKYVLPSQNIIDSYTKLKYIDIVGKCSKKIPGLKLTLVPKAISILKQAAEIRPYYTRTWIFLGNYTNLLIENIGGNAKELKKEAYSYFEKALQLSPKREEVFIGWIQTYLLSKDYQAAKGKAKECINLNPQSSYCWWLKGISNIYLTETEEANNDITIAIEKGYDPYSNKSLFQLRKACETTKDIKCYERLANIYRELILQYHKNSQYHASLSYVYKMLGEYEKAKKEAMIVLEFSPESKEEVEEFLKTLPY